MPYLVTLDNKVIGPEGIMYEERDQATARSVAEFLNSGDFEKALDDSLKRNDYPISGSKWAEIIRKCSISGEQG
jgi:hypothetical protein